MKIPFLKLSGTAKMPERANPNDAGLDLFADSVNQIGNTITPDFIEYGTGIAVEIPNGFVGLLFARSSVTKKDMILKNCVGVIDAGYRGEIKMRFHSTKDLSGILKIEEQDGLYKVGEKIGQLVIVPFLSLEPIEVDKLTDTERGAGGFGSSDNKQA